MKKIVTLSALSLGILFLAGCGQQPASQTQPTAPAPAAQQPAQLVTTSSNSQTYKNDKYGFEFQYPKEYIEEKELEKPDANLVVLISSPQIHKEIEKLIAEHKLIEGPSPEITISYYNSVSDYGVDTGAKSLETLVQDKNLFQNPEQINFAGEKAWLVSGMGLFSQNGIYVMHNNHLYAINFSGELEWDRTTKAKMGQITENIISTFKFTK